MTAIGCILYFILNITQIIPIIVAMNELLPLHDPVLCPPVSLFPLNKYSAVKHLLSSFQLLRPAIWPRLAATQLITLNIQRCMHELVLPFPEQYACYG